MSWVPNDRIANQPSKSPVGMAVFNNMLYMVHLNDNSNDLYYSILNSKGWTTKQRVPNQQSRAAPALAAFGGKLHMVHLGDSSNEIWHSTLVDNAWTPNVPIPGQLSKAAPALAAFGGRLHMVHLGDSSNKLYHATLVDDAWTRDVEIPGLLSKATPALAAFGGKLHMVHLGDSSNKLYHATLDGTTWSHDEKEIVDHSSAVAPALAAFEDGLMGPCLHLVHTGDSSNQLWHSTYDGYTWKRDVKIASQLSKGAPALSVFNRLLHMLHQGNASNSIWHSWYESALGRPLTGRLAVADGQAVYFEFGCMFQSPSTNNEIIACQLDTPRMSNPSIATTNVQAPVEISLSFGGLPEVPLRRSTRQTIARLRPNLFQEIWRGRHSLGTVGGSSPKEIALFSPRIVESAPNDAQVCQVVLPLQVVAGAQLENRRLYDLLFRSSPSDASSVVSHHCVYARTDWTDFCLAHATDLHISARLDSFRQRLFDAQRLESAKAFNNFNNNLRDFIRYANRLYELGQLDGVMMTGDLVDYQFEADQPTGSGGNFALFEKLILGQSPYPDERSDAIVAEELRVPIFASLGNHDWRAKAYPLYCEASGLQTIRQYGSFNLDQSDAETLQSGGILKISAEEAYAMVRRDPAGLQYYFDRLNSAHVLDQDNNMRASYVVRLGLHRIVVIDTAQDAAVVDNDMEVLKAILDLTNEDEKTFIQHSPNSKGMTGDDLQHLRTALAESKGVVIVAMHAPPINLWGDEYPHYFRETEHPTLNPSLHQVEGYLRRRDPEKFWDADYSIYAVPGSGTANGVHPAFPRTGTPYIMKGKVTELLDFNIAKERSSDLLRICAGQEKARPVDLVLCGHAHFNVECRFQWSSNDECSFFFDHYTCSPKVCYKTPYSKLPPKGGFRPIIETIRHEVQVDGSASLPTRPCDPDMPSARLVPPYADELNDSKAPVEWWTKHRPLVIQTAGLGPLENIQRLDPGSTDTLSPTFQGFRLIMVKKNVIAKIQYVTLSEMRSQAVS